MVVLPFQVKGVGLSLQGVVVQKLLQNLVELEFPFQEVMEEHLVEEENPFLEEEVESPFQVEEEVLLVVGEENPFLV